MSGNEMWGGRFERAPDAIMEAINASIDFDRRLAAQDIRGSKAHAAMLAQQGIVSAEDAATIDKGLDQILTEIETGTFTFSRALEDIHMNVESRLRDLIGPAAGRLIPPAPATTRLLWICAFEFVTRSMASIDKVLHLQRALAERALEHAGHVMPGFTHLQSAQPVTFGHHLLAYVEMFGRDRGRLHDARRRLNECPLGAAALAGTSFAIDREATAAALQFDRPTANSLDSVSDRDFVLETLAAASICAVHLSRLAEEIVLWSTAQFAFLRLSDRFSTGSSIMPQKRNPDAAELIRGKSGRIIGALGGLLIVMKGLPLTYSKDMQEDKEGTFDALDSLSLCVAAMTGMIRDVAPDLRRMKAAAALGYSTATDLADWLVRNLDIPFREAHHVTGALVKIAEARGVGLHRLSLDELHGVEPRITASVYDVLSLDKSVKSRTSYGGTAPRNVRQQARRWIARLGKEAASTSAAGQKPSPGQGQPL